MANLSELQQEYKEKLRAIIDLLNDRIENLNKKRNNDNNDIINTIINEITTIRTEMDYMSGKIDYEKPYWYNDINQLEIEYEKLRKQGLYLALADVGDPARINAIYLCEKYIENIKILKEKNNPGASRNNLDGLEKYFVNQKMFLLKNIELREPEVESINVDLNNTFSKYILLQLTLDYLGKSIKALEDGKTALVSMRESDWYNYKVSAQIHNNIAYYQSKIREKQKTINLINSNDYQLYNWSINKIANWYQKEEQDYNILKDRLCTDLNRMNAISFCVQSLADINDFKEKFNPSKNEVNLVELKKYFKKMIIYLIESKLTSKMAKDTYKEIKDVYKNNLSRYNHKTLESSHSRPSHRTEHNDNSYLFVEKNTNIFGEIIEPIDPIPRASGNPINANPSSSINSYSQDAFVKNICSYYTNDFNSTSVRKPKGQ